MITASLIRSLSWVVIACGCCASSAAAEPVAASPLPTAEAALFDYDRSAAFDVRQTGTNTEEGAVIRDITFVGRKTPITAYLVTPEQSEGPFAAILYVHWLGEKETTNRSEFLKEAVALAGQGVVSLLINAMWAEPKWYDNRVPEQDYDHAIQQVIELRRSLDFLISQPGIDPQRIAFVGHDFGAMYGIVAGALDRRPTTYVLMAGTPHLIDWFLFARQPKSLDEYRRQLAPLDPIAFLPQLSPAPVFFQFGSRDEYVSAEVASKFFAAAAPRKQMAVYDAGHDLQSSDAVADRITWLMRALKEQR
jgi:predicted esterase